MGRERLTRAEREKLQDQYIRSARGRWDRDAGALYDEGLVRVEQITEPGPVSALVVRGVGLDYTLRSPDDAHDLALHLLVAAQVIKAYYSLGLYDAPEGGRVKRDGQPSPRNEGRR